MHILRAEDMKTAIKPAAKMSICCPAHIPLTASPDLRNMFVTGPSLIESQGATHHLTRRVQQMWHSKPRRSTAESNMLKRIYHAAKITGTVKRHKDRRATLPPVESFQRHSEARRGASPHNSDQSPQISIQSHGFSETSSAAPAEAKQMQKQKRQLGPEVHVHAVPPAPSRQST